MSINMCKVGSSYYALKQVTVCLKSGVFKMMIILQVVCLVLTVQ